MNKSKEIELTQTALELLYRNNYIEAILTIKKDNNLEFCNIHYNKEYFN